MKIIGETTLSIRLIHYDESDGYSSIGYGTDIVFNEGEREGELLCGTEGLRNQITALRFALNSLRELENATELLNVLKESNQS